MESTWTRFAQQLEGEAKKESKATKDVSIEQDARKIMSSVKGDKVDSFTKRRLAMESDESTEAISGSYKEITEGQAIDNIRMAEGEKLGMDWGSPHYIKKTKDEWERISKEPLSIEFVGDKSGGHYTATGSELAILRLKNAFTGQGKIIKKGDKFIFVLPVGS